MVESIEWEGLGGLSHGSFFGAVASNDCSANNNSNNDDNTKLPPAKSLPQTHTESLSETASKILTGEAFCYSPNLAWFAMAVGTWCVFPYDLEGLTKINDSVSLLDFLKHRLLINHVLALAYIGFWHWALYFRGLCHRPYVPNRIYSLSKVSHNVFYTVLGILQWTLVEGAFLHLYTSGRLPYVDASTTPATLLQTLVLSILLPSYRDIHFYFAHRLIHLRPLYKYVHSLHHRNTDTEPFSGLAMHPVEHMYYFTCYGPLLIMPLLLGLSVSPFLVFWMGVHLVISPAASHSGYEDHFSADLLHYLHHRCCECNYSAGINFDAYFGTFKASLTKLKPTEGKNKGKNTAETGNGKKISIPMIPPPPADPKSSLGFPEHLDYESGIGVLVLWSFWEHRTGAPSWWVALLISVGPVVWAVVLAVQSAPKSISRKRACLAPFDRDSVASLALHLGLGVLLGVLPATHLLVLVLQEND